MYLAHAKRRDLTIPLPDPDLKDFQAAEPDTAPHCTVVVGGGSGIGQAYAQAAAQRGASVVILGRRQEALEETAQGSDIAWYTLDVRNGAACASTVNTLRQAHGRISRLLVCSAIYPKGHFLDQDPSEWNSVFEINVLGVSNILRAVLPGMLQAYSGRIVVVGSMADINPIPGSVAYSASKGALHAMVKGIAAEISPTIFPDVLINEMSPGATKTAMSPTGHDPSVVVQFIDTLMELPAGGPSGAFFQSGKRLYLGETWKGAIRRKIGL